MLTGEDALTRAGLDAVALTPSECELLRARELPVETVTVDWEDRGHLPDRATLRALREAGADAMVGYPARGLDAFLG